MNEITLIKFDLISHIFQTIHGHAIKSYYEVYTSNTFCTETETFTYIPQIHSAQDRDIHVYTSNTFCTRQRYSQSMSYMYKLRGECEKFWFVIQ